MKNAYASGEVFDYTVPSSTTITSGQVVKIGEDDTNCLVGIAATDGVEAQVIAVNMCGVYKLDKATGVEFAQGERVYYNFSTKKSTTDKTKVFIGFAYAEAASGDTEMYVKIRGGQPTIAAENVAGAVADLGAVTITLSTSNTYSDSAVKTAVDAALATIVNKINAELAALRAAGLQST